MIVVCTCAAADTITLKNGGQLKGKIVSQTEKEVTIEVGGAGTVTVKMSTVAGIEREPEDDLPQASRERADDSQETPSRDEHDQTDKAESDEKKPSALEYLARAALGVLINSLLLWGAINAADPGNRKNKFLAALGWSIVTTGAHFLWPFYGLVLALVVLMMILLTYYDIGFFRSILVIVLLFALHIGTAFLLVALVLFAKGLF